MKVIHAGVFVNASRPDPEAWHAQIIFEKSAHITFQGAALHKFDVEQDFSDLDAAVAWIKKMEEVFRGVEKISVHGNVQPPDDAAGSEQ